MFCSLAGSEGGLFDEFRRLQEEIDNLFDGGAAPAAIRAPVRGTFPPMNVGATPEKLEVYLFAAGLDPKRIELSVQQNLLTVSGEREVRANEEAVYYRRER